MHPLHFFGFSCASLPAFPVLAGDALVREVIAPGLPFLDGLRDEIPEVPDGGSISWFACRAGFAALVCDPTTRIGSLERCWVHPEFRGHGYADALYLCREAQGRLLGMTRLRVVVRSRKIVSRFMDRSFGLLPPFVEDGIEKYELTHNLEPAAWVPSSWSQWLAEDPNRTSR